MVKDEGPRFDITPLGRGQYLVSDGGGQRLAYAAGPPEARWVFLDGLVHVIDVTAPGGAGLRARHDEMALASPMPASVTMVGARPGQRVSQGDVLVMLEAMKMELLIRAPHDGTVKSVACSVGDLVQPGIPLVELE